MLQEMYAPDDYARAVREAQYHVQILIESVDTHDGVATLTGPVVNVFRGPSELVNSRMQLQVFCSIPEDEGWPPPGVGTFSVQALRPGRFLEALVNQVESGMEIPLDLSTITDSASANPQLKLDFRPTRSGRRGTVALLISAIVVNLSASALLLLLR
jgi:hypothetical protein